MRRSGPGRAEHRGSQGGHAALLVGAVERLVLSDRAAGLLQVRGKAFDVAVLGLAGAAVVTFALWVPSGR